MKRTHFLAALVAALVAPFAIAKVLAKPEPTDILSSAKLHHRINKVGRTIQYPMGLPREAFQVGKAKVYKWENDRWVKIP